MMIAAIFCIYVLTEMSCEGFVNTVIFPYLGTFPLGLALSFIGPVGYVFKNSFGKGLTVQEARGQRKDEEVEFDNPASETE